MIFQLFLVGFSISNQIQPYTQCYVDAISVIYPFCDDISHLVPEIRKLATVRLTICELEESGIDIPSACEDIEHSTLNRCIGDLEKSPQWWSTYTGYYKHISAACHEYAHPYQSQTLLRNFQSVNDDLLSAITHVSKWMNGSFATHLAEMHEASSSGISEVISTYQEVSRALAANLSNTVQTWIRHDVPFHFGNALEQNIGEMMYRVERHYEFTLSNIIATVFVTQIDEMSAQLNKTLTAFDAAMHSQIVSIENNLSEVFIVPRLGATFCLLVASSMIYAQLYHNGVFYLPMALGLGWVVQYTLMNYRTP
ncbi:hypothetical protein DICA3_D07778 [Diutina catenulata]